MAKSDVSVCELFPGQSGYMMDRTDSPNLQDSSLLDVINEGRASQRSKGQAIGGDSRERSPAVPRDTKKRDLIQRRR
jgi:hypothetical protein